MQDKITYFDFKMYVLPGALLGLTFLFLALAFGFYSYSDLSTGIFDSVIFIIISYIFGQVIQIYAHTRPEKRLKKKYWDGMYPTERLYFPWDKSNPSIIPESIRKILLDYCKKEYLLTEKESKKCENLQNGKNGLSSKLRSVSSTLKYRLLSEDIFAKRIEIAESSYQLYRGLYVGSFWGFSLSLIGSVILILSNYVNAGYFLFGESSIGLLVWASLNLLLWYGFKWRCRGAGQGYAREIVRFTIK